MTLDIDSAGSLTLFLDSDHFHGVIYLFKKTGVEERERQGWREGAKYYARCFTYISS